MTPDPDEDMSDEEIHEAWERAMPVALFDFVKREVIINPSPFVVPPSTWAAGHSIGGTVAWRP